MKSRHTEGAMAPAAQDLVENALMLYAMGSCDQATRMLADALEASPSQVDILKALVEMLVDSGRHQSALNMINSAHIDPEESSLALARAICHLSLGDASAAGQIADRMVERGLMRADAITIKGKIAFIRGEYVKASELFDRAVALNPDHAEAHLWLGYIRRDWFKQRDCLGLFEKALQSSPLSREIALAFHETAVALAEHRTAEEAYRRALTHQRLNRRLRFLLIDVLLRQENLADAMSEIESCMVDFGIDGGMLAAALSIRQKIGVRHVPKGKKQRCSVSLCMIVKDEEKHLARCLQSVKPVVDEIILVDTGSSDRTKDIAAAFGAQVFDFQWCDDFSAARNFSLLKASGRWIMILDADEVLSSRSYPELTTLFQAGRPPSEAYSIQTRNYSNQVNTFGWTANKGGYPEEQGTGWFPSNKVRIFPNDPRIQFANPVHELVEASLGRLKIPVRHCRVPVHHYGKLDEKKALDKTKGYKILGRRKLGKNRRSRSAIQELAIQCAHLGEHEEALRLWKKYLNLQPKSAEAYLNMGTACWNLSRYAEAVAFAEIALRLNPGRIEADFNKAIGLLMLGRAGEAKPILQKILYRQPDHPAAQFMLCVACSCLEDLGQVGEKIAKMKATPLGPYLDESFLEVAKRLISASQFDYARRTVEVAVNLDCGNEEMVVLLERCRAAA